MTLLPPTPRSKLVVPLCLAAMAATGGLGAVLSIPPWVSLPLFAVLFAVASAQALRSLGFEWGLVAIVLGGVLLDLAYLSYTGDIERNYDGPEQFRYMGYIINHGRLPPPTHCTICHHPPLYYLVAAAWFKAVAWTRLAHPALGTQWLSLVFFLVFLTFGMLTVRQCTPRRAVLYLATALMVFWPYSVINSVRVHNDALAYPLMAAALYFTVRWQRLGSTTDAYWAAALAGLSVLTKSSGYLVLLPLGVLLVVRAWRRRGHSGEAKTAAICGALLAGFILGSSLDKVGWSQFGWRQRVLGTACNRPSDSLLGQMADLVCFDLRAFLAEPFLVVHHPINGSDCFWNSLLKSSLFGTYNNFADPELSAGPYADLARGTNAVFFAMLLFGLAASFLLLKPRLPAGAVLVGVSGTSVLLLVVFRIVCPNPHHTDFRHVFLLLVPASLFYAEATERLRLRVRALGLVGYGLAVGLLLLSVAMFLPVREAITRATAREVELSPSQHLTVHERGTPVDFPGIRRFPSHHVLWFRLPGTTAGRLDVSVDHDDIYQVEVVGARETRRVSFGANGDVTAGLERYQLTLDPPVYQARSVALRPVQGDGDYALGHLLVLPPNGALP